MSDSKEITVIIYRSTFALWFSSMTTWAGIGFISVANHRWGGASTWIDALAVIFGFFALLSMAVSLHKYGSFRGTKEQAIEYLKSLA